MRCPDCNKFVSFDTDQELDLDLDIDGYGNIAGICRIVNCCAECGQELKEATLDVAIDCVETFDEHAAVEDPNDNYEHQPELGHQYATRADRRRLCGAEISVELRCSCGAELGVANALVETAASSMDELV